MHRYSKSSLTFDKFHVMKMVNEAVDQVRREEQHHNAELKNTRYMWLKNVSANSNLTPHADPILTPLDG